VREAPERAIGSDRRAGKWGLAIIRSLLIVAVFKVKSDRNGKLCSSMSTKIVS
jgi:hypothetical protein